MAKKKDDVEVAELVPDEGQGYPKFKDAVFGIRGFSDIKNIVTNPDYQPHVHVLFLLTVVFLVGAISYAVGV